MPIPNVHLRNFRALAATRVGDFKLHFYRLVSGSRGGRNSELLVSKRSVGKTVPKWK